MANFNQAPAAQLSLPLALAAGPGLGLGEGTISGVIHQLDACQIDGTLLTGGVLYRLGPGAAPAGPLPPPGPTSGQIYPGNGNRS